MNTGFDNQDLTGTLPAGLGDLGPALKFLNLNGNQISELPTELGTLTGLTRLDLYGNAITSVPTELGALTGLESLGLAGNTLTSLPSEFWTLTRLRKLLLNSNAITSLPFLGALTGLTNLRLQDNAITAVPPGLGAFTGLRSLFLQNNQLTGVPADFRTVNPSGFVANCNLSGNPGFSCANVGAGTICCTGAIDPAGGPNPVGNNCGEGLPGGPCYAG